MVASYLSVQSIVLKSFRQSEYSVVNAKWIFWSMYVAAFIWLMVSLQTEIEKVTWPLIRGQLEWILVAALLQLFYYIVFAAMFKSAFFTVDIKRRIRDLLPVTLGVLSSMWLLPGNGRSGIVSR